MTPLGSSVWMMIGNPQATSLERHGTAWRLWNDHGLDAALLASRAAATCMIATLRASESSRLQPAEPTEEEIRPLTLEQAQPVGERTWAHLGGLVTSFDIDVFDPTIVDELTGIATQFQGDAVFMFGFWGNAVIHELANETRDRAEFDRYYDWIEAQVELLDRDLGPGA